MEKNSSSPRSFTVSSCWGCLKLNLPWRKRKSTYNKSVGGFGYDPLSYSQNFDEGLMEDDEESSCHRFSTRYAAPSCSIKSLNCKQ
jgi:hypothetical protein